MRGWVGDLILLLRGQERLLKGSGSPEIPPLQAKVRETASEQVRAIFLPRVWKPVALPSRLAAGKGT